MYNYEIILKSIELFKTYKSKKRVSKIMDISKTTIIRWIKKYNDTPTNLIKIINKTHVHKEQPINIKNNIKKYIIELFTINPFYTRKEIQNLIFIKFNYKIGLKKLRKVIISLNFTYKKAKYLVIKDKNYIEKLKNQRAEFEIKVKTLDIDKIICIDECSFNNLYGSNLKGHSLKGKQINIPINEKKFINNSLLMALTTTTVISNEIHINKINSIIFKNFIELIIKNNNLLNHTFIFDNVSFHKNKETLNFIKESGNNYLFTPPYSPNNNPIENMFSIVKHEFRKQIITDIIDKKIVSNKEYKLIKENNKIKLIEICNDKILNIKSEMVNELLLITNNDKKLKKGELNKLIRNKKKENKNKIKELEKIDKEYIKKELEKYKSSNIIKTYIDKTLKIIKSKYTRDNIKKIFDHAFNYNYENIEKEIRDRITFLRN